LNEGLELSKRIAGVAVAVMATSVDPFVATTPSLSFPPPSDCENVRAWSPTPDTLWNATGNLLLNWGDGGRIDVHDQLDDHVEAGAAVLAGYAFRTGGKLSSPAACHADGRLDRDAQRGADRRSGGAAGGPAVTRGVAMAVVAAAVATVVAADVAAVVGAAVAAVAVVKGVPLLEPQAPTIRPRDKGRCREPARAVMWHVKVLLPRWSPRGSSGETKTGAASQHE